MHSPWVAIDLAADPVTQARLLRRAHEVVLSGCGTPPVLREVVVGSWARCQAAGVDPDRPAPVLLGPDEAAGRFAAHPLAGATQLIRGLLDTVSTEARHIVAVSDAAGVLLWSDGHPRMLEAAAAARFVPGAVCTEAAVGTNAIGTALALRHAVQIFSAEHFTRLLHGWTCAAAPVHDPATGEIIGVIDVSGSFRNAHPHTLTLVTAAARAVEAELAADRARRDAELVARYVERLSAAGRRSSALIAADGRVLGASPRGWLKERVAVDGEGKAGAAGETVLPGGTRALVEPLGDGARILWAVRPGERRIPRSRLSIRALGREPPELRVAGLPLAVTARQAELLVVLAMHPDGLSAHALARCLYEPPAKPVTARAEVARLRRVVGELVGAQPYRITAEVHADFLEVERLLARRRVRAAVDAHVGPLLPASHAPAIVARRAALEAALRRSVRDGGCNPLQPPSARRLRRRTLESSAAQPAPNRGGTAERWPSTSP